MYLKDQINAVAKFALAFDAEIRIDTGGVGQVAFDLLKEAGVKVVALSTGKNADRLQPLAKYTCPFCEQVLEQDEKGLTCKCGYKFAGTVAIKEVAKEL